MSAPRLTPDLLAQPAPLAARAVARERLVVVEKAYENLVSEDHDALHRMRVSLRRLRSWLRSYRPFLDDTLRKKTRRALAELAHVTNPARDAEVALDWVRKLDLMPSKGDRGRSYLEERLEAEFAKADADARNTLARDLPDVCEKLADQLSFYWIKVSLEHGSESEGMGFATARLIRRQVKRLSRALHRVVSEKDVEEAHEARIEAKRLRYLLEPLDDRPTVLEATKTLTDLQDALGDFRDKRLLADRILQEIEEMAGLDAGRHALALMDRDKEGVAARIGAPAHPRALKYGLIEIARRSRAEERASFARFAETWSAEKAAAILKEIEGIADGLRLVKLDEGFEGAGPNRG